MLLRGVSLESLETIVEEVSNKRWSGNLRLMDGVNRGARVPSCTFKLRVKSSRGPGHRLAAYANYRRYMTNSCPQCHHFVDYNGHCAVHGKVCDAGYRPATVEEYKTTRKRMTSACWHVHRDVLESIFDYNPGASVKSGRLVKVHYKNQTDFEDKFPDTYDTEVGYTSDPQAYGSLCDCAAEGVAMAVAMGDNYAGNHYE